MRVLDEPSDEYDWDGDDAEKEEMDPEERVKLEDLYEGSLNLIRESEVVEGTIVSIGKKEIVVNIGYKSEGVIGASEFRYNPELRVGDRFRICGAARRPQWSACGFSPHARIHSAWLKVNASMENDEIIMGTIKCRTKGGLIVDVFGIEAFLPGSQIDVKPIRDYDEYVGKQMEFKVVKINQEYKNVVVSHKALIEAELEEQKRQIISGLEKGQVLEGVVKNITSYGVFVDLGGVDGLVHITDLSWGRVNHPEEVVEVDQSLNVVILDFDDDRKRIALGIKQLTAHPWDAMSEGVNVGDKIKGKVVVVADYGAFVEVAEGVEGLLHVSEMSWSQHLRSAQEFLKVGDEIETIILGIDREERKMSLGMKQLVPDPWDNIEFKFPVQSKHSVRCATSPTSACLSRWRKGIDGLVHISDLSWEKKIKHPSEFCNVGDEIDVVVSRVGQDQPPHEPRSQAAPGEPLGYFRDGVRSGLNPQGNGGDHRRQQCRRGACHMVSKVSVKPSTSSARTARTSRSRRLQISSSSSSTAMPSALPCRTCVLMRSRQRRSVEAPQTASAVMTAIRVQALLRSVQCAKSMSVRLRPRSATSMSCHS